MPGDIKSLADMDRALEPIVTHVWSGKKMPFPVLLDNTFKTQENFGLQAVAMLLIDPQGNLVRGTLKDLEEKLNELGPATQP